jgi:ribose transport system substrate-binding protein
MAEPNTRHKLATVTRACQVLKLFADDRQDMTLAEIVAVTGFEKTIAFRIIHTLESEGLVRKVEAHRYRSNVSIARRKRFRIGYASQADNSPFSDAVTASLKWECAKLGVDLITVDNRYSARSALRNADRLIEEKLDLAIEFQTYERIAAKVAGKFRDRGIPLIAVDIPHPGAVFFGIDNYRVGLAAGQALVKAARRLWDGKVDELLLLELEIAGSIPHLRLAGVGTAVKEGILSIGHTIDLDTKGEFAAAFEAVRKHLRVTPRRRTLVAGINDPATLGALRAFEEAGRSELCAVVALGAVAEAREELRKPGTRLLGSVAFFPERYGEQIMRIALDILNGRTVQPAQYGPFQMITPQNVDLFYPGDRMLANPLR